MGYELSIACIENFASKTIQILQVYLCRIRKLHKQVNFHRSTGAYTVLRELYTIIEINTYKKGDLPKEDHL